MAMVTRPVGLHHGGATAVERQDVQKRERACVRTLEIFWRLCFLIDGGTELGGCIITAFVSIVNTQILCNHRPWDLQASTACVNLDNGGSMLRTGEAFGLKAFGLKAPLSKLTQAVEACKSQGL